MVETPAPTATPVQVEKAIAYTRCNSSSSLKQKQLPTGFVLQAGYFGSEANAQKLVNDLKAKGYEKYLIKTTLQNGTTFTG